MRLHSLLTLLAAPVLALCTTTVVPMNCISGSRNIFTIFQSWDVTISLTSEGMTFDSDENWVTDVQSLQGFLCKVLGEKVKDIADGSGTPPRYELRMLSKRYLENEKWSSFYDEPVTVRVGGGRPPRATIKNGKDEGFVECFGDKVDRYCVVDEIVAVS